MSSIVKTLLTRVALVLLSVIFSLTIAELILRVLSVESTVTIGHHKLFCEYDPLLGWKNKKNTSGWHVTPEYKILESFNSKGIRGPEYSYEKTEDEFRIFILGDSFAEGHTVEFEELFSEVLKRKLNESGDQYYQVINSGTGGYSTDQELLLFQTEGSKYNPDLTILMFYQNDVWYNNQARYWRGYKPFFELENGELVLTNFPVPEPDMDQGQNQDLTSEKKVLGKVRSWLGERSYLYQFVATRIVRTYFLYKLAMKLGLVEDPEEKIKNNDQIIPIPDEFRIWEKVYNDQVRDAWRITEAIITKLQDESTSIGSELLVFHVPSRANIYMEEWQATKLKYGISDDNWNIEQVEIELEAVCEKNKVDFFSPTYQMKTEAKKLVSKKQRLYFISDGHWNSTGHQFVGEILAEYVTANYLEN